MAMSSEYSSSRSSHSLSWQENEDYPVRPLKQRKPAKLFKIAPYDDLPASTSSSASCQIDRLPTASSKKQPTLVFLPSNQTAELHERVLCTTTKIEVVVTGSAALGKVGLPIGSIDIAESKDSYMFRVPLPGVSRDPKTFSCNIGASGKIQINGVTLTGERRVYRHNMVFEMQTQNLCPSGEFSIVFQLPGPVDHRQLSAVFETNAIFEGVVTKRQKVK